MGRLGLALRSLRGQLLTATDGRDVLMNTPDGWEVEQPWLWWTGPAGSNGTGGPWGNPIPGANAWAGLANIPGVARASSLIVDTISTLPWHVYRNNIERLATPSWVDDPQALRLDGRVVDTSAIHETRLSAVDMWGQWILSALWFGDGFIFVPFRDEAGAPKPPLYVFHPADIELVDGAYKLRDADDTFAPGEILHLRGQQPITGGRGTGVLSRFASDLAVMTSLRDYMTGAFASGVPAGYLKVNSPNLDPDKAQELKDKWMTNHGGRRSIAVLNATTEFHPLTWSPVDVGAADFSRISLNQVALMFGLPAYLLGAPTDSNTYANVESRMTELYELTLLPWMRRIEDVLDAQLPRGTALRIEIDALLRADTKTRYESYQIALTNGFLTVDEVREFERRPPLAATGVL
jgi:HK97 family phage portal protein